MVRDTTSLAGSGTLTAAETEHAFLGMAHTKLYKNSWDKNFFLAFVAGFWVSLGAHTGSAFAGGIPLAVRTAWPILPKLGVAITFPLALNMIVLFGGQLFTGDCMLLVMAWYRRKTPIWRVAYVLTIDYIGNFAGCLFFAFFFSKLTKTFSAEPYLSYVQLVAVQKTRDYNFGQLLLRAIPANMMVCLATYLAAQSRDSVGKFINLVWPPYIFVIGGFEHVVADMYFISNGMLYHAGTTVPYFLMNQAAVGIGNFIGGGIFVGLTAHALLHWRTILHPELDDPEVLPGEKEQEHLGRRGGAESGESETTVEEAGIRGD